MKDIKGILCTDEKIKQALTDMIIQTYTPKDGDSEQHKRLIHQIKNDKQHTNICCFNGFIGIRNGNPLEMDSENIRNRRNAGDVFGSNYGYELVPGEDDNIINELAKYIEYDKSYMYLVIPTHEFITELPELNPITIDDVIKQEAINKVNKSDFIDYFEQRYHINHCRKAYDYFDSNEGCIARLHIDTVFEDIEHGGKYGIMYNRIYWDNALIGYYSRTGKYLDTYSYCTFDKVKWDDMISTILREVDFSIDECVEIVDRNADLYNHISIHGRGLEEYGD